jgi:hypothetical protein
MDFVCGTTSVHAAFDLALLRSGPHGRFVYLAVEAPWGAEAVLLPSNSKAEKGAVVRSAFNLVQQAQSHLAHRRAVHCPRTWSQNPWFFPIVVARALVPEQFGRGQDLAQNNAAALDTASCIALW